MNPLNWLSTRYRKAARVLISTGLAEYADAEEAKRITSKEQGKSVSSADRAYGGALRNPHELVDTKTLAVFDTMMLDEAVGTFIDTKKTAALSTSGQAEPADDESESVKHADHVNHNFERLPGTLTESLFDILSAVEYGYSATNRPWEYIPDGPFAGKIGVKALKTKSPHSIAFDTDEFLNIKPDGILFTDSDYDTKPLPLDQFIVYTYRKKFGDPYGCSDCLRAYVPWNSKRWMMKMWDIYGERYAMGTLVATYKKDANGHTPPAQEHAVIQKFGNDVQARSFISKSDSWGLELLEASGRGTDFYDKTISQRNMAIARAMFIPDQIGFSDVSGGSFAKAQTHLNVFMWPLEHLRRDMTETIIGEQIIKPLIDLNYGPQEKYPQYVFEPLTDEQKAAWLTAVFTAIEKGAITPDLEIENRVRQMLEIAEKEEDEEVKAGGSPPTQRKISPTPDQPGEIDEDDEPPVENIAAHELPAASRRRELTIYEQKVDVDEIARVTNDLHDQFVNTWADHFREQRRLIIEYTRKKGIVANGDYQAVAGLKFNRTLELRKSLQRYLAAGSNYGALQAQNEIKRARSRDFSLFKHANFEVDLAGLPLDEIDKYFEGKGLVTSTSIKQASALAKKEAFWITGDVTENVLAKSKTIIRRGIRRGDQVWTEGQLKKLFDGYIKTGEITDGKLGTTYRIETIARNQFTTAFNQGRKALFEDPDVEDFVEAYQWSAVLDNATTDYCAALDTRVLSKEDVNSIGWPPAHHNCRSIVVPITQGESYTPQKIPAGITRGAGFELCAEHGFNTAACGCE